MFWSNGLPEHGEIKLVCPKCLWTTTTRSQKEISFYSKELRTEKQ